ncbi:anti-sigma factor [Aeromicrobium sp.]|uniref:anti-sigma factor n=1 Tax=Aeromicrobium sp. TaxID=1871063 RepID=UPI0019B1C4AE|nr:anti-sigma factor [Aeromicrobium sp.]MBC7632356.1 anti-sigma factor [Aeromicrobium sp.]
MSIDLHSLMAPYALHALESHERARFETHLDQCVDCQDELSGFVATAARLGESEAHMPPAALRDRLMSAVATTPQERPVVVSIAEHGMIRRTLPRLAMAAAFLVGTVGIGGFVTEHNQATEARAANESITSVLAAADADTTSKNFNGGGNIRLISSSSKDAAVIVANNLPALNHDKVYQVWMITGSSPKSQGVFTVAGSMVMKGVTNADRVAITVEPKGGSTRPTSPPIATLAV